MPRKSRSKSSRSDMKTLQSQQDSRIFLLQYLPQDVHPQSHLMDQNGFWIVNHHFVLQSVEMKEDKWQEEAGVYRRKSNNTTYPK